MSNRVFGIGLINNNNYEDIIRGLYGLPVVEQIKIYQDIYDKEIPFKDYYWAMYPQNQLRNNTPCPIHDEDISGESFSIDSVRNMWQCFGKCKTVGRAVHFEYMMSKKDNPGVSRLDAIKSLHKKFPNLPKPVLYESDDIKVSMETGKINIDLNYYGGKNIVLNSQTEDMSLQILQAMIIEKNMNRK